MKYKFKKRLICEFATYMYKRKKKTIKYHIVTTVPKMTI
jgi:hypothetical protein